MLLRVIGCLRFLLGLWTNKEVFSTTLGGTTTHEILQSWFGVAVTDVIASRSRTSRLRMTYYISGEMQI